MEKQTNPETIKKDTRTWAIFAIVMFVLDFASKWIVQLTCKEGVAYTIIPNFLYVTKTYNTGMAFSLGAGKDVFRILFSLVSLIVSIAIAIYYFKSKNKTTRLMKAILALIFAGALGNFIDRILYFESIVGFNGVIDFIQFYLLGGPSSPQKLGINPFATFNIADSCLTIGCIIFAVYILIDGIKDAKREDLSKDPRLSKDNENQPKKDE